MRSRIVEVRNQTMSRWRDLQLWKNLSCEGQGRGGKELAPTLGRTVSAIAEVHACFDRLLRRIGGSKIFCVVFGR